MNFTYQIKKNDTGDACSTTEGEEHVGFCWGHERKKRLGRPKHGWEDNIKLEH